MKIYTIMSPSHHPLGKGWENTLDREQEATQHIHLIPIPSDGDYRNEQWNSILTVHEHLITGIIHENIGDIIGITGVDVRFVRPFVYDVLQLMEGYDLLMQDEDGTQKYYNPDVMFMRCTPQLLLEWVDYLKLLPLWNGHMDYQNRMMAFAFQRTKVGFLPIRYASTLNGGADDPDMRLFHANNLHAPGCVEKKLEALRKYE